MNLKEYYKILNFCIEKNAKLVAVSKTKPAEDIQTLYNENQRVFGENKVQELVEKQATLPKDIQWHFIGHLQKNKVKYIAPFIELIHAVDSLSLLKEISKKAIQNDRKINCFIQFHIAKEDSKFGLRPEEIEAFFTETSLFKNANIIGVMGMATFTDNKQQIKEEFKTLKDTFKFLKNNYFQDKEDFKEISMGMSGDFEIALNEGSTMVRVGSSIFGKR
jgi:pyridoxal phosphate enzyme (YggS family)